MVDPRPSRVWLPTVLCIAGVVVLALDAVGHLLTIVVPFSVDYTPRYYSSVSLTGMAYVIVAWRFASHSGTRLRLVGLAVMLALLVAGIFAYLMFHTNHPVRWVQSWDGMERVTPYHEQLAIPLFVTLITGPLVLISAVWSQLQQAFGERHDVQERLCELEIGELAVREQR